MLLLLLLLDPCLGDAMSHAGMEQGFGQLILLETRVSVCTAALLRVSVLCRCGQQLFCSDWCK